MDDEIFQGVSFAAVKEQLQLLGHDLPDDVILAYLTEDSPPHQPRADAWLEASCSAAGCHADGHAGASGERCPLEPGEGGRPRPWSATGRPDARCSLQSHSDVDQHPCSVAGSASASDLEGTRAREAYDEEQLLLLLRLSEADGARSADSLAELGHADWSGYERADCAATLHMSARCVLSPMAQQWPSEQRRPEKEPQALSSRELKQRAAGYAAAELRAPGQPGGDGGRVAQLPCSPPGNAGGATGVLSPPCAEATAAHAAPAAGDCARQAGSSHAEAPCDLAWGGVVAQGRASAAQRHARERGAVARHTSLDQARRWRPAGAEGAGSGSDSGAGGAAAPADEQPWPHAGLQPNAAPPARPGYYDPPPSGRRGSQPARPAHVHRRKSEPAARCEAGDHRYHGDCDAEGYAGPGRERRPASGAGPRGFHSPERWPRLRGRAAAGASADSSAADCASHPAHDPARNRAVLAAAARRPPRVDRVARYQEIKRIWDSDPFLRAGGGGAIPTAHRPPAGFREAFEAAHAAEAEERAYWARVYAAGGVDCSGGHWSK